MKKIKLTYNQEMSIYKGKEVAVKQNGIVAYVSLEGNKLIAKNWLGQYWDDVQIISEMFEN